MLSKSDENIQKYQNEREKSRTAEEKLQKSPEKPNLKTSPSKSMCRIFTITPSQLQMLARPFSPLVLN